MIEKDLYKNISGVTGITSINVTGGYGQSSSVATIVCEASTLSLNDIISIDMGYVDAHEQVFYGRVKNIIRNREQGNMTIVAKDMLVDATDFFMVADNPEEPFKRQNISAQNLVGDLLGLANITNYSPNVPLNFTYGVSVPAEFNLVSVMDACNQVANVLAWHIYADVDVVRFEDIRPYYRYDADKFEDYGSHLGDDVIDYNFYTLPVENSLNNPKNIEHNISDEGIRNKVVVYGRDNLVAKASAPSDYLPANFYKTAVIASPLIDTTEMAEAAAKYNLKLYNRLTETCTVDLQGNTSIKPRKFCTIADTFTNTSGNWFISNVNHTIGGEGFITKITCTR